MLTTMHRSRPKGPLRAVSGATNNRKISGRLRYCDTIGTGNLPWLQLVIVIGPSGMVKKPQYLYLLMTHTHGMGMGF